MTVREIFDLRKQGHIEEAYEAIKPMYAVHKGYYTSLCMYLCARDIFNIRLAEGKLDEATKIYQALQRLVPYIDDKDGTVAAFMKKAEENINSRLNNFDQFSSKFSSDFSADKPIPIKLNKGQQSVLDCIQQNPGYNVPKISAATGIPSKSIERHIKALIEKALITHQGSKKTGGYFAK